MGVETIYQLYKHQNLHNGKIYISISKKNPIIRCDEGNGYKYNDEFYKDIVKYGWDEGFSHEILLSDLKEKEAQIKECEYILKYDSVRNGYNIRYAENKSILPKEIKNKLESIRIEDRKNYRHNSFKAKEFDFYNFKNISNEKLVYKNKVSYFAKIPNKFIQCNLKNDFGLNRIFLLIYFLIDRNRSYEDVSYIVIGNVLKLCGYKLTKTKSKIFYEIIKCILFLKENYFIETDFDIHNISYNDLIQIKIISENFDSFNNFTKVYGEDVDSILGYNGSLNKENIIAIFLYINSYIGCRANNNGDNFEYLKNNPEAFWKSIESMAKELSMSKDTINQCLEYLTCPPNNIPPLLVKREVGSVQPDTSKPPKNVPNIYVLNKEGYEKEIEWALNKMLEIYKVDKFLPVKNGNYRFKKEGDKK